MVLVPWRRRGIVSSQLQELEYPSFELIRKCIEGSHDEGGDENFTMNLRDGLAAMKIGRFEYVVPAYEAASGRGCLWFYSSMRSNDGAR